jgi:hypothetical protein
MKEGADEGMVRDFALATAALAEQMGDYTYNLPASYAKLAGGCETKEMIEQGNSHDGILNKILEMYNDRSFPVTDADN